MIDALGSYLARHVFPRRRLILVTSHPYIALGLALLYVSNFHGIAAGLPTLTVDSLSTLAITYDTVAFGFCVAAIALAIAIPNSEFLEFISRSRNGKNPYRDLVFVFSWTGVAHWFAFIGAITTLLLFGKDSPIFAANASFARATWFVVFLTVQMYAAMQFLVNLLAVSEAADLYGNWLANSRKSRSSHPNDD